jgi:integrase
MATYSDAVALYARRPEPVASTDALTLRRSIEAIGTIHLSELRAMDIQLNYTDQRLAKAKPGTVARELRTVRAVLNYAVRMGIADRVCQVRLPRVDDARTRFITKHERDALIEAAWTPQLRALVGFLLYTGARLGEAIDAKPEDVRDDSVTFVSCKGAGSRRRHRQVPLHPQLRPLLVPAGGRLLPSPWGTRWSNAEVHRQWTDLCDLCRLEDLRLHDCRHFFASSLVAAGVDLLTVCSLTGHASVDMLARYTHLAKGHKAEAIATL